MTQSLAGFSVYDVSSGKLFTSTGMQFHHIFNISLCGGATNHPPVICRNNISSSAVRTFLYRCFYLLYAWHLNCELSVFGEINSTRIWACQIGAYWTFYFTEITRYFWFWLSGGGWPLARSRPHMQGVRWWGGHIRRGLLDSFRCKM